MVKCPFLDPNFDIGIDDPCPVCGVIGTLDSWSDGNLCVGDVVDTGDELHQVLGEALRSAVGAPRD